MRRAGAALACCLLALVAACSAADAPLLHHPPPPDDSAAAAPASSYEARARAAAADAALSVPLAAALASTGAQLDACGADASSSSGANAAYLEQQGGLTRLAEDLRDISAAAERCGAVVDAGARDAALAATSHRFIALWSTHSAASSAALRERLSDLGHHLKFVRDIVTPCVLAAPGDEPPHAGAWLLNDWLRDARDALEAQRGCLAREPTAAVAAHTCGCMRAAGVAAAVTFASTAAAAAALGAIMRPAQAWAAAPRRRFRGADALGQSDAGAYKRHSIGAEAPRPFRQDAATPQPARDVSATV
jgi:hypothetical protein